MKKFIKIYLIFSFFLFSLINCYLSENIGLAPTFSANTQTTSHYYALTNSDNNVFITTQRKIFDNGFYPDIDSVRTNNTTTRFQTTNRNNNCIVQNNPIQLFRTEIIPNAP